MNELGGGGWAKRLLKSFNKVDLPATIFIIFTTGGIDFVGGFTLFKFLQRISGGASSAAKQLGNLDLASEGLSDGDAVFELLFKSGKVKVPAQWAEIIAYF